MLKFDVLIEDKSSLKKTLLTGAAEFFVLELRKLLQGGQGDDRTGV